jgi:hypothetical protein
MSERFKFPLSQAFDAGGLEKEGVMYYVIGGLAVVLVSLFIVMLPDLIRFMKIRSM